MLLLHLGPNIHIFSYKFKGREESNQNFEGRRPCIKSQLIVWHRLQFVVNSLFSMLLFKFLYSCNLLTYILYLKHFFYCQLRAMLIYSGGCAVHELMSSFTTLRRLSNYIGIFIWFTNKNKKCIIFMEMVISVGNVQVIGINIGDLPCKNKFCKNNQQMYTEWWALLKFTSKSINVGSKLNQNLYHGHSKDKSNKKSCLSRAIF